VAHQVWTFSTGVLRGHEAAPIVAENTMFVATPFLNILYAIDLTQPGGTLKSGQWRLGGGTVVEWISYDLALNLVY
jgi:glucose dehydrogenase